MLACKTIEELRSCHSDSVIEKSILIRRESPDRSVGFLLFEDSDALENLEYDKHSYHEVITEDKPRKFMLDIDLDESLAPELVMQLVAYFRKVVSNVVTNLCKLWEDRVATEEDLHLFVSPKSDGTLSGFHLVLANFMFRTSADIEVVFSAVRKQFESDHKMLSAISPLFAVKKLLDPAVLRRSFSMRIARSCKLVSGKLERPKEYRPTDEQIKTGDDWIEHGILTQETAQRTKYVALVFAKTQLLIDAPDIPDEVVNAALARIYAVKLGSKLLSECFVFRNVVGTCIVFDKVSSQNISCAACKREHDGDNTLFVVGPGVSKIGDTLTLMCRRSNKSIISLFRESNYPFDLAVLQGIGKTDAGKAIERQKKVHMDAIRNTILQKEKEYRVEEAAKGLSVSVRRMKEMFDPLKRKMITELEESTHAAYQTLSRPKGNDEVSAVALAAFLIQNLTSRINVTKYENSYLKKIRHIIFESIDDLVSFVFTNYWWSTHDGLWLKERKGWKRICDTDTGICPSLTNSYYARIKCGSDIVHLSGNDLWKPLADFCQKEQSEFVPEPLTLACAIDPTLQRHEMNPEPESFVNQWRGLTGKYALQQHFNPENHDEYIRELEYLLFHNLSDGKQEYFDYLVSWLACAMQRPDRKTGVLILLSGRRGIGKSQLISALNDIVPHARQDTKGIANLTGRFNSHLESTTLYMFPESPQSSGASAAEFAELKSLIADSGDFTIEAKFANQKTVELYHNYLVASNFNSSVELEDGDRRFCIIPNQDAPHGHEDTEYWDRMHPMLNSVEFRASFQRYLLSRDISKFDPRRFPKHEVRNSVITRCPITEFVLSAPQFRQRVDEACRKFSECGNTRIDVPTLETIVQLYARDNKLSGGQIAHQVKKLRHEVNENEELRKVMKLHPADRMGLSTHSCDLQNGVGVIVGSEYRQFSHAFYFLDDKSSKAPLVDPLVAANCKIADLERQLEEMKQLLAAAVEKKAIADPALLKLATDCVKDKPVDYNTWTKMQLSNELKRRNIKVGSRDSHATLLATLIKAASSD